MTPAQTAVSLSSVLMEQTRARAATPYIRSSDYDLTYADTLALATRAAARLAGTPEIARRNAVGLTIESAPLLALAVWSAAFADLNVVFLPRTNDVDTLTATMRDGGVDCALTDQQELCALSGFYSAAELLARADAEGAAAPEVAGAGQAAFLFQTSGTSGEPKWVRCFHWQCALAALAMRAAGALEHAREQTVFVTPPLYHSYGLSTFLEYTCVGSTLQFPPLRSPFGPAGDLQDATLRERVTAIEGVPYFYFQLARLLNRVKLPNLRHAGLGGGALDRSVIEKILAAFPGISISVRYGLTETPSVATHKVFRPPYQDDWSSSGRIIPVYDVRIEDAQGQPLPPGQDGEIVIRGECVASYRGDSTRVLRTGDLGHFSERSELFVVGRSSSYLKHRGFRLSPEQIESVVGAHEGVRDCRVLTRDGALIAEVVCDDEALLKQLPALLSKRLPAHAVPDRIVCVTAVPRTPSGKIKRHS
jgi:acyl-coenzyme A synthetase/AMP-(fatty) acid ligase